MAKLIMSLIISLIILFLIIIPSSAQSLVKFQDPSGQVSDLFGYSSSVSNDIAIIGSAYATRSSLTYCGIASIWQYNSPNWVLLSNLQAYDRSNQSNFGFSVSLSTSSSGSPLRVLVGSPLHPYLSYIQAGATYLYEQQSTNLSQWNNITKFLSPIIQSYSLFGYSVAISSKYLVISAVTQTVSTAGGDGAVYIYYKDLLGPNKWGLFKQLVAPDPHSDDQFGFSVATDQDLILVGARNADNGPIINTGKAYLFGKNNNGSDQWGLIKQILAPYLVSLDQFGWSVSISGDIIFIGSPSLRNVTGAGHVFYRNQGGTDQWDISTNISLPNPQYGDHFGSSVVVKGTTAVIG